MGFFRILGDSFVKATVNAIELSPRASHADKLDTLRTQAEALCHSRGRQLQWKFSPGDRRKSRDWSQPKYRISVADHPQIYVIFKNRDGADVWFRKRGIPDNGPYYNEPNSDYYIFRDPEKLLELLRKHVIQANQLGAMDEAQRSYAPNPIRLVVPMPPQLKLGSFLISRTPLNAQILNQMTPRAQPNPNSDTDGDK